MGPGPAPDRHPEPQRPGFDRPRDQAWRWLRRCLAGWRGENGVQRGDYVIGLSTFTHISTKHNIYYTNSRPTGSRVNWRLRGTSELPPGALDPTLERRISGEPGTASLGLFFRRQAFQCEAIPRRGPLRVLLVSRYAPTRYP